MANMLELSFPKFLHSKLEGDSLVLLFVLSFWNMVALQCCVSIYHTTKCISYTYTYIPSFLDFLSI